MIPEKIPLQLIDDTQSFLLGYTWSKKGGDFFECLAEYLAGKLDVDYVCIDALLENFEAQTVAVYFDGRFEDNVRYKLQDTPCGKVSGTEVCCFTSKVRHLFPKDQVLQEMEAESYAGITLHGADGRPIGLIAVIGRKPLKDTSITELILKQVSIRAAAELEFRQAKASLEYYAKLVETVSEAIISTDDRFTITKWNKAAENMYGWKLEEVIGMDIASIFHTEYPEHSSKEKAIKQLVDEGYWADEVIQRKKDGTFIHVASSVTTIKDNAGNINGVVAINRDITKRKLAEEELSRSHARLEVIVKERTEELRKSEEKYRTVAENTYNWETWIGPDGKYIYMSPACEKITGYGAEEFLHDEKMLFRIIHKDDRAKIESHFKEKLEGNHAECSIEFRILTRKGSERWIGHSCKPVYDNHGNWIGQRGSNRDITEQKNAEQVLLLSQKNLRALTNRINAIAEEERTNIAREIHDELGHLLTALKFDIANIADKPGLHKESKEGLNSSLDLINSLIESVQKISTELRPGILDHLGLFPAIEWQVRQFQKRMKIHCTYQPPERELVFNEFETITIFRILQEILTNIARHSKATHVLVSVNQTDEYFYLSVTDNGVGFSLDSPNSTGSLGLLGMRERALSIGGEINIESEPGKGTKVSFRQKKLSVILSFGNH